MSETKRVFSGAHWEKRVAYCRAICRGSRIWVSGTASVGDDGRLFGKGDGWAQARRCLEIIRRALEECGAGLEDVVRTRMFVTDISRWEEFGSAHAEAFGAFPPATSMVEVARLIDPGMLIEIEAEAELRSYISTE